MTQNAYLKNQIMGKQGFLNTSVDIDERALLRAAGFNEAQVRHCLDEPHYVDSVDVERYPVNGAANVTAVVVPRKGGERGYYSEPERTVISTVPRKLETY